MDLALDNIVDDMINTYGRYMNIQDEDDEELVKEFKNLFSEEKCKDNQKELNLISNFNIYIFLMIISRTK